MREILSFVSSVRYSAVQLPEIMCLNFFFVK